MTPTRLSDPVTARMHQDFTQLRAGLTVGEALDWLRLYPPPGRVIYFYVVDDAGRLLGVVPTRRLLLSDPATPLTEVMVKKMVVVPSWATVLDACEFFIQYRLLAFPVVDEGGRVLGVIDVDLYTDALAERESGTPVGRLVAPLARFFRIEASGGVVLLLATAAALILANWPAVSGTVADFWEKVIGIEVGDFSLHKSLLHWINDGLMTLFFFLVGLEIKRELTAGELADPRKALLPVVAALGGMLVPAGVYLLCLWGGAGRRGWAVPMATDIAFVVGVLTLLGPRVPHGLKVLLLSLAIADDVGSVLVIAGGFSHHLSLSMLAVAAGLLGLVVLMRWLGFRGMLPYAVVGVAVWLAFVSSGLHPTLAGVMLGLLTPSRGLERRLPIDVVGDLYGRLLGQQGGSAKRHHEPVSPLDRLERALHPWVAFVIMPLFALANAGVAVRSSALLTPVALGVAVALTVGKPLGIVLFSWLAVRLGLARLPEGVSWKVLIGAGCLGGIGFTMSLFIAGLAFGGTDMHDEAKIGILLGSLLSGVLGSGILLLCLPRREVDTEARPALGA
jgi:NhaA family Na+:H+ antiporter